MSRQAAKPKALQDSALYFGAQLAARLINFVYFLILTRKLPIDEFGVLNYVLSIIVLLDIMVDLGLSRHAMREVSRNNGLSGEFLRRILPYKFAASTLVFVGFTILVLNSGQPTNYQLISIFAALGLFFTSPAMVLENILQAHHRFRMISCAHLALSVLQFLVGGAILVVGGSTIAISFTFALTYFLYAGIVGWGVYLLAPSIPPRADYGALARSIPAAFPYLVSAIVIMFAIRAEYVVLGYFGSKADLAVFGMASKIIEASLLVPMAFSTVMSPRFSKAHAMTVDTMARVYHSGLEIILLVSIPVCLIAIALVPVAQYVLGTDGYDAIDDVLFVTFLGFVPASVFLYNTAALFGATNQKKPLVILSFLGAAQIAINIVLQSQLGMAGAAIAFVVFMVLAASGTTLAIHFLYAGRPGILRALTAPVLGGGVMAMAVLWAGIAPAAVAGALALFALVVWLWRHLKPQWVTDLDLTPERDEVTPAVL